MTDSYVSKFMIKADRYTIRTSNKHKIMIMLLDLRSLFIANPYSIKIPLLNPNFLATALVHLLVCSYILNIV